MQLMKSLVLNFVIFQSASALPMPAPEPQFSPEECAKMLAQAEALAITMSEINIKMVCTIS
jgi:hypothetical protein